MRDPVPNRPVRERTRSAVLQAAMDVMTRDPGASLGEVATAAGVARSTLHRYYRDRAELVTGIEQLLVERYEAALDAAEIESGPAADAFERLVDELLERLASFAWWMQSAYDDDPLDSPPDQRFLGLIRRGQTDGTIDAELDAAWVASATWSFLWLADRAIGSGRAPREIRAHCRRSLLKLVAH